MLNLCNITEIGVIRRLCCLLAIVPFVCTHTSVILQRLKS